MGEATYKSAGVDLEKYADAMARLPRWTHRTFSPRVMKLDGGFAGLFQLDFAAPLFQRRYEDPVLVACTDGVGTKLKVAVATGQHRTVGIDLVAMCVNDAVCCGAEPLFFLDYVAMSEDDPSLLEQIVSGISEGCLLADSALLGGETAIMPDLYAPGDYDLAGFSVGVVNKSQVIDGSAIAEGDTVLGLASSGLHSNGYSLVRRIVFETAGLSADDHVQDLGSSVKAALLEPTRIYVSSVRNVLKHYKVKNVVHGIAHITGGGVLENVARILPPGRQAVLNRDSWDVPAVFSWLQKLGSVHPAEMDRVFNRGIGMVLVVGDFYAAKIRKLVQQDGINCWEIGKIEAGTGARWAS